MSFEGGVGIGVQKIAKGIMLSEDAGDELRIGFGQI
jgi:hypothetical protein